MEYLFKSSEPAVSLKKELSEEELRLEPKLVADRYGTVPRKCLPRRTLPVINKFPLVSIGEGLCTRELRKVLGGIVLEPIGLPIPGFSIDQLVGQQSTADNTTAIMNIRIFIMPKYLTTTQSVNLQPPDVSIRLGIACTSAFPPN